MGSFKKFSGKPLTAATVTARHMDLILSDQKNDFKKRFGLGMSKICIRPQKFRDSKEMRRDLAHFLIYKDHGGKRIIFNGAERAEFS